MSRRTDAMLAVARLRAEAPDAQGPLTYRSPRVSRHTRDVRSAHAT